MLVRDGLRGQQTTETKKCDYEEMIFLNSSDVTGKHYTTLTGSRVRAGFVKIYVYFSISGNDRLQLTVN